MIPELSQPVKNRPDLVDLCRIGGRDLIGGLPGQGVSADGTDILKVNIVDSRYVFLQKKIWDLNDQEVTVILTTGRVNYVGIDNDKLTLWQNIG